MVIAAQLQLVLVTPEVTLLDEPVKSLRVPLFDGSLGIYPGHSPLVGRLGAGELAIRTTEDQEISYFVDGGFVQMNGAVVSVLTNRAIPITDLEVSEAEANLEEILGRVPKTEHEHAAKERDQNRARAMLNLAMRQK